MIGLALALLQVILVGQYKAKSPDMGFSSYLLDDLAPLNGSLKPANTPDIYYILPDGYPRSDTLDEYFNFKNDSFDRFLGDAGFYIAKSSHSNYNQTALSTPSGLNMSYIGEFDKTDTNYKEKLFEIYKNNRTFTYFRDIGYRIINNSNWYVTKINPYADFNIDCEASNEFLTELISTTALSPLNLLSKNTRKDLRSNALCVLDNIDAGGNDPKLVFTHLLPPHPPYIFGENGEDVNEVNLNLSSVDRWRAKQPYISQLKYVNDRLRATIERILKDSKNDPIILIQSDHGTLSSSINVLGDDRPIVLRERSRNYLAVHLPRYCDQSKLYPSLTPVNTFRVILNSCFDEKLELLSDTIYYNAPEAYRNARDITKLVGD